jgi:CheY-like chemotaxis protein
MLLLLGLPSPVLSDIQEKLARSFYVWHPELVLALKDELEEARRPDAIILYLENFQMTSYAVINKLLQGELLRKPTVIIGREDECEQFRDVSESQNIVQLIRPVTLADLYEALRLCTSGNASSSEDVERRKSILLVDDDRLVLRTIRGYLADIYEVNAVASGKDALRFLEKRTPDLVLLDYMMHEMTGTETLEAIRALPNGNKFPVAFLTSSAEKKTVVACLSMNPDAYLVKPISKQKLLLEVEKLLRSK